MACGNKNKALMAVLGIGVGAMSLVALMVGFSHMTPSQCFAALLGDGTPSAVRIMQQIRLPRVLAAVFAGAALSVSGLIMQTTLNNMMASPSTLGVSNGAVFGANLSIIFFAGGYLSTGNNPASYGMGANPFATGLVAFIFAVLSVLIILALCNRGGFSPGTVVLAGIALGYVWTAGTTLLQFYATDIGLSAAVIWSFGDLGRATFLTDGIMLAVLIIACVYFAAMSWQYNALLSGEQVAVSLGVSVKKLRFISLLLASLLTAVCVSFLGIIGFVGIICPHVAKKLLGQDHRWVLPASALTGSLLLLCAETLSRCIGNGAALPVGAITSLLGAPFFLALIFGGRLHPNA